MKNKELKSFKDLSVWQKAADLAVLVYKITDKFPRSELYGIINQMRRAVISISSNLAEGFKRVHKKEKLQFYNVAYSSASELESQIEISKKLGFLQENDYQDLILLVVEVSKMINGLIKSLNSKSYILNSQKDGYLMIELIIAIVIIVVGILSIIGFLSKSLSINRVISSQFTANYLAMEGIEIVKNIIDANVIDCLDKKGPWNKQGFSGVTKCYEIDYQDFKIPGLTSTSCPDGSNNPLLFDSSSGLYSYDSGVSTRFFRTIQIAPLSNDEIQVNSIIKWRTRGGGSFSIDLEDHFFNWLCNN